MSSAVFFIVSVFNELRSPRGPDGSPFETCCLCEVLGWSPEQKCMFMTDHKHTHIVLWTVIYITVVFFFCGLQ